MQSAQRCTHEAQLGLHSGARSTHTARLAQWQDLAKKQLGLHNGVRKRETQLLHRGAFSHEFQVGLGSDTRVSRRIVARTMV